MTGKRGIVFTESLIFGALLCMNGLSLHALAFNNGFIQSNTPRKFQSSSLNLAPSKIIDQSKKSLSSLRSVKRAARLSLTSSKMSLSLGAIAISSPQVIIGSALMAILTAAWYWLSIPSRTYTDGEGTVGKEYDAWTEEGILEYYWV